MSHKIFVSYKYHDNSVCKIGDKETARDYVDKLQEKQLHQYNINKAEEDGIDFSIYADETIKDRLKNRIWDSTITLILISPEMVNHHASENIQWIPWEISYSLEVPKRKNRHSNSNALIAVVLPQKNTNNPYNYFLESKRYIDTKNDSNESYLTDVKTFNTFQIIRNNMFNNKNKNVTHDLNLNGKPIIVYHGNNQSYIEAVTWRDFFNNYPSTYYRKALKRLSNINDYSIQKEIYKQ